MTDHVVVFAASAAKNGLTGVAAVTDQIVPVTTDTPAGFAVPKFAPYIRGVFANGVNMARAQIRSPTLRTLWGNNGMDVRPVRASALPLTGTPEQAPWLHAQAIKVDADETIQAYVDNANNVAQDNLFMILSDQKTPSPPDNRPHTTVRATGTTVLVAGKWTPFTVTFDDPVPAGSYDCIGMAAQGATLGAVRVVPNKNTQKNNLRPSILAEGNSGLVSFAGMPWRHGNAGKLFSFDTRTPPTFEGWAVAGDTAQTLFLDLVKTA